MRRLIPLLLALAVFGWSCGGNDTELPATTTPPTPSATTPTEATPTATAPAADTAAAPTPTAAATPSVDFPAFAADLDLPGLEQTTETQGGGRRPVLEWASIEGADYYIVALFSPAEKIYWGWRTSDTSVPVGGAPKLDEDALGPAVSNGMTWSVIAFGADGNPMAASARRPISP